LIVKPLQLRIDHVGILAPLIAPLVDEFRALGFSIVGPTELTSVDASGKPSGLGQFSAHVMFDNDYIELTAVEAPFPGHHLEQYLDKPWGLRLLLIACEDIEQVHAECRNRDLASGNVLTAGRSIDYQDGAEARFKWFGLEASNWPETLVAFVQHLSRDIVFDERVARHTNGASGITRLYCCADKMNAHYEKLASDGKHQIDRLTADQLREALGFEDLSNNAFVAIGIGVLDLQATTVFLSTANIDHRAVQRGVSVRLQSGTCLVFECRS
jgi:hypothetical protein